VSNKVRAERRELWFKEHGPCVKCGSWEKLEADHIDRATKLYDINRIWTARAEVREAELAKCQVLCKRCHRKKTNAELRRPLPPHGTRARYQRGPCHCELCSGANRSHERERVRSAGVVARYPTGEGYGPRTYSRVSQSSCGCGHWSMRPIISAASIS
jgi:hypothetical protein